MVEKASTCKTVAATRRVGALVEEPSPKRAPVDFSFASVRGNLEERGLRGVPVVVWVADGVAHCCSSMGELAGRRGAMGAAMVLSWYCEPEAPSVPSCASVAP
eukprot:3943880-Pyramimonas_sp.AAC.1